jgi:archaellum component FlaG (FlaF/FlaG flagellin family)
MKIIKAKNKRGQVAIMLVLIIMVLSIVTTAAVALALSTTRDTTTLSLGERALMVAESGAENTILQLIRDPDYAGESGPLSIGPGNATIELSGTSPITIMSTGVVGNMVRKVEVQVNIVSGQLTVLTWREI